MTPKEILDSKIHIEFQNTRIKSSLISAFIEDYYNMIILIDFTQEEIEKMLIKSNLLEDLAISLMDDERFLILQEKVLSEYLMKNDE